MQREESIEVYRKTLLAMKPDTKMKYMKCPHQGYDMSDCDIVAGVVQCPLHGLKWNVQMGESVQ
jgi:nitrite reductase/ring-hydroxylating ferredoxin subunit